MARSDSDQFAEAGDSVEVTVEMVVVRIEEHGMQPCSTCRSNVHRHRVADVRNLVPVDPFEERQGVFEDQRVGLGHANDVAIDHDSHRNAVTIADLTDSTSRQDLGDLATGIRHHTDRHARCSHRR